jgi:hypothetical protein
MVISLRRKDGLTDAVFYTVTSAERQDRGAIFPLSVDLPKPKTAIYSVSLSFSRGSATNRLKMHAIKT